MALFLPFLQYSSSFWVKSKNLWQLWFSISFAWHKNIYTHIQNTHQRANQRWTKTSKISIICPPLPIMFLQKTIRRHACRRVQVWTEGAPEGLKADTYFFPSGASRMGSGSVLSQTVQVRLGLPRALSLSVRRSVLPSPSSFRAMPTSDWS